MNAVILLWRDPILRLAAGLMIMNGTLWASFGPFVALLAVETFKLGDRGYAAVMVVATLLGVLASLAIGIRADQKASRRRIAIATCAAAVGGLLLMTVLPSTLSFIVFHALIMPVSSTIFGQIFTLTRLAAAQYAEQDRQAVVAAIRAAVSLPFVIVLPLLSMAMNRGVPLTAIYPMALVFSVIMAAMVYRSWPADSQARWEDNPSGLSLRAALKELTDPGLALRIAALGAVASMPALYVMTLALILTQIGGRPDADPGLFFGLVAGGEVPSMLLMAFAGRFVARLPLILIGSALSAVFLLALPLLAASPAVWILILPLALAHGVLLPVPITYLQDLLSNRPGTGAALMALQGLIANILAAAAFTAGTWISGYSLVMVFGAIIGVAGAVLLWALDHKADHRAGR